MDVDVAPRHVEAVRVERVQVGKVVRVVRVDPVLDRAAADLQPRNVVRGEGPVG